MLKCQHCGGALQAAEQHYVCESCGRTMPFETVFENVEVFVCCISTDKAGRRTKSDMLAREIYQKLSASKINTSLPQLELEELAEDDYERCYAAALFSAKVVVVLATEKEEFALIKERYGTQMEGKKIVPVFSDMDASQIPADISGIQGLNVNNIAFDKDLVVGVLNLLGREPEPITKDTYTKRKRLITIISLVAVFIAMISLTIILVLRFGLTPSEENKIQSESKLTQSEATQSEPTQDELYTQAVQLSDDGNYYDAIKTLFQLGEYKDSKNLLQKNFSNYDGYYYDATRELSLRIWFSSGSSATVEVENYIQGKRVAFTAEFLIDSLSPESNFIDVRENSGTVKLEFSPDTIYLSVHTDKKATDTFITAERLSFSVSEKMDKPLAKELTKDMLYSWLRNKFTTYDLKIEGIETEEYEKLDRAGSTYSYTTDVYDVEFIVSGNIVAIKAPVNVVCPEKIGTPAQHYVDGDIHVFPLAPTWYFAPYGDGGYYDLGKIITENDYVCISAPHLYDPSAWEYIMLGVQPQEETP